jgi:hypothetical protein
MGEKKYDALTCLSEEELEKFEPLSEKTIAKVLKDGERERDAFEATFYSRQGINPNVRYQFKCR